MQDTHHVKDAGRNPSPLRINDRLLLLCDGCALCDFDNEAVAESEARVLQALIFPVGVDFAGPDSGVLDQDMRGGLRAPRPKEVSRNERLLFEEKERGRGD